MKLGEALNQMEKCESLYKRIDKERNSVGEVLLDAEEVSCLSEILRVYIYLMLQQDIDSLK